MNKKHYKLIAEAIKAQYHDALHRRYDDMYDSGCEQVRDLTNNLATILKMDNPRFDRDKFLTACGF